MKEVEDGKATVEKAKAKVVADEEGFRRGGKGFGRGDESD